MAGNPFGHQPATDGQQQERVALAFSPPGFYGTAGLGVQDCE
jgi:hypothetical protein